MNLCELLKIRDSARTYCRTSAFRTAKILNCCSLFPTICGRYEYTVDWAPLIEHRLLNIVNRTSLSLNTVDCTLLNGVETLLTLSRFPKYFFYLFSFQLESNVWEIKWKQGIRPVESAIANYSKIFPIKITNHKHHFQSRLVDWSLSIFRLISRLIFRLTFEFLDSVLILGIEWLLQNCFPKKFAINKPRCSNCF